MAKLTNVRERVHQPFYDTLVRTSGLGGNIQSVNQRQSLFTNAARQDDINALTNLQNGSTLPSDQSHVTLALRVFTWFRNPMIRGEGFANGNIKNNGDFSQAGAAAFFSTGVVAPIPDPNGALKGPGAGNYLGSTEDVYRLYWQAEEQLHWSYGTGEKFSITNMPTKYFPDGGGLSGDLGGSSDLIHFNNGTPDHTAILRLARAILLPPRQNVKCVAEITPLPDGGNASTFGLVNPTNGRNMLSLQSNLNATDGINKVIQFTFDGLFARDVQ
jgi:hypothetical protein